MPGDGVAVKGQAYGIRSLRVDGNDPLAIHLAIKTARKMAIEESRPILIEVKIPWNHLLLYSLSGTIFTNTYRFVR